LGERVFALGLDEIKNGDPDPHGTKAIGDLERWPMIASPAEI